MKRLIVCLIVMLTAPLLAKGGTHPEFDLLDKEGNPITESSKPLSTFTTCGDCHDRSENIEVYSDYILARTLHPRVPLRDANGELVVKSGSAMSNTNTCGVCHDVRYINAHSDHANAGSGDYSKDGKSHEWASSTGYFGAWNVLDYDLIESDEDGPDADAWLARYGSRHVGGGPVAESVEMNCLICHTTATNLASRSALLSNEQFEWANSALLSDIGLVIIDEAGEGQWQLEKFDADGAVLDNVLPIQKPTDDNCGQCHGLVSNTVDNPLSIPSSSSLATTHAATTLKTGQIFSPQKISMTGLNVVDKESLTRPLDVHSARVVSCTNCHYSLNNPVYYERFDKDQPIHLEFDPRRLAYSDYIKKPLHQFAKGGTEEGLASVTENSLRRCESCHKEETVHDWLPYKQRHFAEIACESCHIPELYGPTLMTVDWTLPSLEGEPGLTYRNSGTDISATKNSISKFVPILLPRDNVAGTRKLAPYNLITGWFWLSDESKAPISREDLASAFTEDGQYLASIIEAFDQDMDGKLSNSERQINNDAKFKTLQAALIESGIEAPKLSGEISAHQISHNVVNGKWATRECRACHNDDSLLASAFTLSSYRPNNVTPVFASQTDTYLGGNLSLLEDGSITYASDTQNAGYYVIGLNSIPLIDWVGIIMFLAISLGVTGHAIMRKIANKRNGFAKHTYRKEYIYEAYERFWHWMQATSILILLVTGLIIHKPVFFALFSFRYMVEIHNIVGFILFANAALALFYNLASGQIKQYLPEPKGFIGRSIAQATYYSKGIFKGDKHPIKKTRENKLNPLQQVTYLMILNILLPAQVITGILIWGAQRWPELATSIGGLTILAPLHTLIAWLFATFIVMHVYLTTTGHTPTAGIKAMISGWDHVEEDEKES